MSGIGEKTPLLQQDDKKDTIPTHTRDRTSSFYFEQKTTKKVDSSYDAVLSTGSNHSSAVNLTSTDQELEVNVNGVNSVEFSSRPVVQVGTDLQLQHPQKVKKGILHELLTPKDDKGTTTTTPPDTEHIGTLLKQRKVPIKVEPKVFFSNERTFIAWLHVSTILAGGSITIVAFANANPWSQMYGIVLLPVSISFIVYAMWQYVRRSAMIRRHEPGPYEDLVGPSVLGIMLMISIAVQFSIKMYTLVYYQA